VGAADLVVVVAPETSEEAGRLFAALLSAGFHPSMDYGGKDKLANFPILAPQGELGEAKAFLRGLRVGGSAAPASRPSMFDPTVSDRPVGPLPAWTFKGNVGKPVAVMGALIALAAGIVAVVSLIQFLTSLKSH
jgi:hypothetical protein